MNKEYKTIAELNWNWHETTHEGDEAWDLVGGRMKGTDYKLALIRLNSKGEK